MPSPYVPHFLAAIVLGFSFAVFADEGAELSSLDRSFVEWAEKRAGAATKHGDMARRFLNATGRDADAYERGMDRLERDFRAALGKSMPADGAARLAALEKFFFEDQGFRADLDLELPENLYPDAILERKRGYCLGLTLVLLDLGERLRWPLAAASAPRHIFLRDVGDSGKGRTRNLETTRGGESNDDAWYVERFALTTPARRALLATISPRRTAAHLINNHGFVLLAAGQLEVARREFQDALRVDPGLVEATINLGVLEARGKSFRAALTAFESALEEWPDDAELLLNRLNALISMQRWNPAAAAIVPLARVHPKVASLEKSLAAIRSHLNRRDHWPLIQNASVAINERLASDGVLAPGLKATYYGDRRLKRRVLERVDPDIEFQWKWQAPTRAMPRDDFSIRWKGYVRIPSAARYTLTVICSDGVRVWIDGERVLDSWIVQRNNLVHTEIELTEGLHDFRVEYFEGNHEAGIKVFLAEENAEEFLDLRKQFFYRVSS